MNYLGIDIGSTNVKCRLSDDNHVILYTSEKTCQMIEIDQQMYVDIEKIYIEIEQMILEASNLSAIDAISVSSFGESFVLLDEDDQIIMHPMIYTDNRGLEEAREVKRDIDIAHLYNITGTTPQSLYSIYKLLWFKKNHPSEYNKVVKFMQIGDYINYRLTGKHVTDYSLASRSGIFDLTKKEFSKTLLDKLNINIDIFPNPLQTGSIIGVVHTSLLDQCQVVVGGHDQVMAAIGSGAIHHHAAVDGMGTVECLTPIFRHKVEDISMGLKGYVNVPFFDDYCTYMFNYTGGSLVQWAKKNIFNQQLTEKEMEVLTIKHNHFQPTKLLTLPYFSGAATPNQNINAKGSIINLTSKTTSYDIYQSILEGLAFEMKYNLEIAKHYGIKIDKIIASGGGSNSRLWLQIKADVFNQKIYPLEDNESGITGAIILCAVALKKYKDLGEAVEQFVKYKETVQPNNDHIKAYEKQYQKYIKLYDTLQQFSLEEEENHVT